MATRKDGHTKTKNGDLVFEVTMTLRLTTADAAIDIEEVVQMAREEIESLDISVGDDQHTDESNYTIEVLRTVFSDSV